MMGRNSCTIPSSVRQPARGLDRAIGLDERGGGALPDSAAAIAADAPPSSADRGGIVAGDDAAVQLADLDAQDRVGVIECGAESLAVSVSSWSLRSARRAVRARRRRGRSARSVPLTKSSMSDASRLTTPPSVGVDRWVEVMATSALAVTPTSTRTTPKTSASSIGGAARSRVIG